MNTIAQDELMNGGLQRVSEAAEFLGVSRSYIYKLIREGVLPSVKLGKNRRVPVQAVRDLALTNLVIDARATTTEK